MGCLHLPRMAPYTTNCWLSTFEKPEDEARSVSVLVNCTFTVIPE